MTNHCCDYRNPCHSRNLEEEKEQEKPAPSFNLKKVIQSSKWLLYFCRALLICFIALSMASSIMLPLLVIDWCFKNHHFILGSLSMLLIPAGFATVFWLVDKVTEVDI